MAHSSQRPACATLVFTGHFDAPEFLAWIEHRANKLGLCGSARGDNTRIDVTVIGTPEMIDAMELCCSLGPASAWVDAVKHGAAPIPTPTITQFTVLTGAIQHNARV